MEIITDTNYTEHQGHNVQLESSAVITQDAWWTLQGDINFLAPEVVEYNVTELYELRCSDCELVLEGFDIYNA